MELENKEPYTSDVENIAKYNLLYGGEEKTVIDVSYDVDGYVIEIKIICHNCHRTWWQNV